MILPVGAANFHEAMRIGAEVSAVAILTCQKQSDVAISEGK